jgi:hypothetical protein
MSLSTHAGSSQISRSPLGLRLVVHAAEEHRRGDGVESRLADGDADHADVYSRLALNWRSI